MKWDRIPSEPDVFLHPTSRVEEEPQPDTTACKHGRVECERCGTSNRDRLHTTTGGCGVVATLREKQ